jgi:IS30 family transposase
MHHHLTRDNRAALAALLRAGHSQADAARHIGFNPCSVSRELKRNVKEDGSYNVRHAHSLARKRRMLSKKQYRSIENNSGLSNLIECLLHPLLSPEAVGHMLGISHETIYAWIDRSRPDLRMKLPYQGRKRRRYGSKRGKKQGWAQKVRSIENRPKIAEQRGRVGDFEGDTMRGKRGALLPHVDRKSLFTIAHLIPNEGADVTHEKAGELRRYEPHTITYDRGSAFALWRMIEKDTKAKVYFAHPYQSQERGSCENTIGRLRRVFPKRFDFSTITQRDVNAVIRFMNHTPRKRLRWRTPCEVFGKCCISD